MGAHGAGVVVRNSVDNTMTLFLVKNYLAQRIIMMEIVVVATPHLVRRPFVGVGVHRIAVKDGEPMPKILIGQAI